MRFAERLMPLLHRFQPETAHNIALMALERGLLSAAPPLRRLVLNTRVWGLTFDNPVGLAAGFDKDGRAPAALLGLGFGFVEVGSITPRPQPGNPKPRLFRLDADRAVINRMGFNNGGHAAMADRLNRFRAGPQGRGIVGVNLGRNKDAEDEVRDYVQGVERLGPIASYLVVNVSSPNTPGLRSLQAVESLRPLLTAVKDAAEDIPLLVKIAPDLSDDDIRDVTALALELGLQGIVATNTTIARDDLGLVTDPAVVTAAGAGGLSGKPLGPRALEVLRLVRSLVPDSFCVISAGGVETAADVRERLDAGATLVQGYTGFLYRGPLWARQINRGLVRA
ncbi:MAG TPA: dihydroorotate dehydrogenase (quinone) [Microbacterium sp.]|nr:dihydroorotate dehydrogenase (quinone) [Microbacterium sp.]